MTAYVLGIDGCRAGWVIARKSLASEAIDVSVAESLRPILDGVGADAAMVLIDMPIGLPPLPGRACEVLARRAIGPRRSSVFTPPARPMLAFDRYEDANAWGKQHGKGLSKQAWMIAPRIREVDALMTPARQARIAESHPEVAFARLNGAPLPLSKHSEAGLALRRAILQRHGLSLPTGAPPMGAQANDVLDAAALTLAAEHRLSGAASRLSDDAVDARGLVMEIWG